MGGNVGDLTAKLGVDEGNYFTSLDKAASAADKTEKTLVDAANNIAQAFSPNQLNLDALTSSFEKAGSGANVLDESLAKVVFGGDSLNEDIVVLASSLTNMGDAAHGSAAQLKLFDEAVSIPYADATGQLNLFTDALEPIAPAATAAVPPLEQVKDVIKDLGNQSSEVTPHIHEAEEGLKGLAEQMLAFGEALIITEKLKEFGTEALSAVDSMQRATNSLTVLTGGAEEAEKVIGSIEELAKKQPFSFPEMAQSAQRVAAFGIESSKIPHILEDATNAARATGNSFNSIVSSLGRIELTGQVAGRQLMQLGISWTDIARTMGTSIEAAQETLKKGGQTAAEDLDVILKTLEEKFGAFANVPLSIGEQMKVLGNSMHEMFTELGTAIAPVIQQLVGFIKDSIIPAVKSALDLFAALPAPLKDGAVAFGLVVASLAPLAVALGGIVLSLTALEGITPLVTTAMTSLGIQAGVTATEIEAVNVSLGASGLTGAAEGAAAAVGATGLAGAMGAFGLAVGTFGAGIAATISNINSLKEKWEDVVAASNKGQIFDAINSGVTAEAFKKTSVTTDQLKSSVGGLDKEIDYGRQTVDAFGNIVLGAAGKAKEAAEAFDNFGIKVKIVSENASVLGSGARAVVAAQQQLVDNAKNAKLIFDELSNAFRNHKASAGDVALAYQQWQKELKALDHSVQDTSSGVMGYTEALVDVIERQKTAEQAARDAYSTWKDLAVAGRDNEIVMRAADAQWDTFQGLLSKARMTMDDIVPKLADTSTKVEVLTGSTSKVTKVTDDFNASVGKTADLVNSAAKATTESTVASVANANAISIQGVWWESTNASVAKAAMLDKEAADSIQGTTNAAKDNAVAMQIVSGGMGVAGAEAARLKTRYDELNQSLKTQTEMDNGRIATMDQVQKAYEKWQTSLDHAKQATDAGTGAAKQWTDAQKAQMAAMGMSQTTIDSLTGHTNSLTSSFADLGEAGVQAFTDIGASINSAAQDMAAFTSQAQSFRSFAGTGMNSGGSSFKLSNPYSGMNYEQAVAKLNDVLGSVHFNDPQMQDWFFKQQTDLFGGANLVHAPTHWEGNKLVAGEAPADKPSKTSSGPSSAPPVTSTTGTPTLMPLYDPKVPGSYNPVTGGGAIYGVQPLVTALNDVQDALGNAADVINKSVDGIGPSMQQAAEKISGAADVVAQATQVSGTAVASFATLIDKVIAPVMPSPTDFVNSSPSFYGGLSTTTSLSQQVNVNIHAQSADSHMLAQAVVDELSRLGIRAG